MKINKYIYRNQPLGFLGIPKNRIWGSLFLPLSTPSRPPPLRAHLPRNRLSGKIRGNRGVIRENQRVFRENQEGGGNQGKSGEI